MDIAATGLPISTRAPGRARYRVRSLYKNHELSTTLVTTQPEGLLDLLAQLGTLFLLFFYLDGRFG